MRYHNHSRRGHRIWFLIVIGLAAAWYFDRTRLAEHVDRLQAAHNSQRVRELQTQLERDAWKRAAGIKRER